MAYLGFNVASAVKLLLLALVIPPASRYLSDRAYTLSCIFANMPHKLPPIKASFSATANQNQDQDQRHGVLFADHIRNCEDGILVPELGAALLSCDAGRDGWNTVMGSFARDPQALPGGEIWLYRYADGHHETVWPDFSHAPAAARLQRLGLVDFPDPKLFHPIGIGFDLPTGTLFVLNNDVRGPRLEVFKLTSHESAPASPQSLQHLATIEHPLIYSPNSVQVISSTELYVTNDHRFAARYHPTLSNLENYLVFAKGSVVRVKLSLTSSRPESIHIHTVASLPFANGIARLNDTTLAVASTNTASVHLYNIPTTPGDGGQGTKNEEEQKEEQHQHQHQLQPAGVIKLPFLPDNLSVDDKGALLIAGHPWPRGLHQVSRARATCQDERAHTAKTGVKEPLHCRRAMAPSWVSEWTAASGLRDLYVSRGGEAGGFGTSATAVRDSSRGLGFVTGLYDEGILVWKE